MKKFLLMTLLAVVGGASAWAQSNATTLSAGKYYRIKGNATSGTANTYLIVNGTTLAGSGTGIDYAKKDNRDIWTLEDADDDCFYLKNVSTGLYVNMVADDDKGGSHSLSSSDKTKLKITLTKSTYYLIEPYNESKSYRYLNFHGDAIYVWSENESSPDNHALFYEVTAESRYGDCTFMLANPLCDFSGGWGANGNIKNANELYWDGTSRKVFEPGKYKAVEQTVSNLAEGTYTVQVAVRGGVNDIAYMKLNDTDVADSFPTLSGGNGKNSTITKDGLVINNDTDGPTDNGGWYLIQGTANVTEGGSLKITIGEKNNKSWWQMCDVKLLKDANAGTNYTTGSSNTYTDLTSAHHYFYNLTENQLVKTVSNTSSLPNVIVENACAKLKLTDGAYNFGNTGDEFTATIVTYDRSFAADKVVTLCLPFAITADECTNGTLYTLTGYENNQLQFTTVSSGNSVAAYTPCLYKATTTGTLATSFSSKTIAATNSYAASQGNATFQGTMTAGNVADGGYFISNGTLYKASGTGITINPFRGYFTVSDGARALTFALDDETTGIITVDADGQVELNTEVYDLNGRRVMKPTQGLYIVNGKKVVLK